MATGNESASSFGWDLEDFIDPSTQVLHEDDPWGTAVAERHFSNQKSDLHRPTPEHGRTTTEQSDDPMPDSESRSTLESFEHGTGPDPMLTHVSSEESNDDEPSDSEILSLGIDEGALTGDFDLPDDGAFDEPEPFDEYDSGLREDLFEEDGNSEDLHRSIEIDRFISEVPRATADERSQCSELLAELSSERLRYWLTWLPRQPWTGRTLLRFLDFRLNHWEENREWWEYNYWSRRIGHWLASSSYYTLTLDATYELIHLRLASSPEGVIDSNWLVDWNELTPWKFGISSFAQFALFRADLKVGEDWLEVLVTDAQMLPDPDNVEEPHTEYPHRYGPETWFANQDWHDPAEWHDNLDWASSWFDSAHPYMPDGSWYSMAGE